MFKDALKSMQACFIVRRSALKLRSLSPLRPSASPHSHQTTSQLKLSVNSDVLWLFDPDKKKHIYAVSINAALIER